MKKCILILSVIFIGLSGFTTTGNPASGKSELKKKFVIEALYTYTNCNGTTYSVLVQCVGACDPNGNMQNAADAYAAAHLVNGCYQ